MSGRQVQTLCLILIVTCSTSFGSEPIRSLVRKCWPVPAEDSLTRFAKDLTALEDQIRITGSITIKHPDVWGESNLMVYLQEYDQLLAASVQHFDKTVQAYIARSDQADLQASFAMGQGLGTATPPGATAAVTATPIALTTPDLFGALKTAVQGAPAATETSTGVGLEPTEVERQRSTFIKVNQALRRKNIGDDNSRGAGYGLYLFRIPVSVIPGRETFEGHSAVLTLRAQLAIDPEHLRNTFPKLMIAEVVEDLTPLLQRRWTRQPAKIPHAIAPNAVARMAIDNLNAKTGSSTSARQLYGDRSIDAVLAAAKSELGDAPPRQLDLRNFLSSYLTQLQLAIDKNLLYTEQADIIRSTSDAFVSGHLLQIDSLRQIWFAAMCEKLKQAGVSAPPLPPDCLPPDSTMSNSIASPTDDLRNMVAASWCLAAQAGVLNHNLRESLASLARAGQLSTRFCDEESGIIEFYNPDANPETQAAWEALIRTKFPVHVFTLEPEVEEQNAYDAFTRQRQLQLAFAYAVASGKINANSAMNFSRQLELDMATIALNRTTVAFAHSNDTFGWYFYPRIQTPPEERNNLAAFGRLIWSTGPTWHYDLRHRRLEPGTRECEVLIAMPSFVGTEGCTARRARTKGSTRSLTSSGAMFGKQSSTYTAGSSSAKRVANSGSILPLPEKPRLMTGRSNRRPKIAV
jgi:hypothetical protein